MNAKVCDVHVAKGAERGSNAECAPKGQQRDALAPISPITARPIRRPNFCHPEWLGVDSDSWINENRDALRDWWCTAGDAAGIPESNPMTGEAGFPYFCLYVYESECSNREELKREWASLPRERR